MFSVLSWTLTCVFFFKQKTAYEMRISDWSSDVCSSDLQTCTGAATVHDHQGAEKGSGSTTDPVCGMTVDPATTPHIATHGGEHNYFCSAGCLAKFEADPDRYAVKREPAAADAPGGAIWTCPDRKSVVEGKRVSVRVDLGGRRDIKKKKT